VQSLLAAAQPVRAVVRDLGKGRVWADRGCEVALAEITDTPALTAAFRGAERVFVLVPPNFDPTPDFSEARTIAGTLRLVLEAARPARVVYLSTIGVQATEMNLLTQHTMIEQALRECSTPITFCGRLGSWRMLVGTWVQPEVPELSRAFCSRSTNRWPWWRPWILGTSRRSRFRKIGTGTVWSNWKGRAGYRRTKSHPLLRDCWGVPSGWSPCHMSPRKHFFVRKE